MTDKAAGPEPTLWPCCEHCRPIAADDVSACVYLKVKDSHTIPCACQQHRRRITDSTTTISNDALQLRDLDKCPVCKCRPISRPNMVCSHCKEE